MHSLLMLFHFRYEKVMGGAFLGESFRYILLDLAQNGLLLQGKIADELNSKGSISTADISLIEAEFESNGSNASANTSVTALLTRLGYCLDDITDEDRSIVTFAGQLVTTRAALFTAAGKCDGYISLCPHRLMFPSSCFSLR